MKILQIFNRYTYVGGEELAVEHITKELSAHHELRSVTFDSNDWRARKGPFSGLGQIFATIWNPRSIRAVRKEMKEFRPELVLLHNTMPVGSAGLLVYLSSLEVPIIHYIHNFRPFSVNGYCWGGGELLPQGIDQNFWPEIRSGAWQNSRVKTAFYATLIWLLHRLGTYRGIDGWIAISRFMKDSFVKGGIDEDRIRVISHSWRPSCADEDVGSFPERQEPMFLFLGRLTEEKGVRVLLDAWQKLEETSAAGRLVIAGEGPLLEEVSEGCQRLDRAGSVGFADGEARSRLLSECTAIVVPSVWWEPLGLVVHEAYDFGKPVLAARSGGMDDHVHDGVTGWVHEPGASDQLAAQLLEVLENLSEARARGAAGRRKLLKRSAYNWISDFNIFAKEVIEKRTVPRGLDASRSPALKIATYLGDQNRGHGRSLGISRMSQIILGALAKRTDISLHVIASKSSLSGPRSGESVQVLPWGTRSKLVRVVTDNMHPVIAKGMAADVWYYPKGFIPRFGLGGAVVVVTIHDTIIQHYRDHYPEWRKSSDYRYWMAMLRFTLSRADGILTVSEHARRQILDFMNRQGLPAREVTVTYEPCVYESVTQPVAPEKGGYALHLASREPHKMTAPLVTWWLSQPEGRFPPLHLVGNVSEEVEAMIAGCGEVIRLPRLSDAGLQRKITAADVLVLPSEIEGFGLPALEAYYLGTPVCHVKNTSVEEILAESTRAGRFSLSDWDTLGSALEEVLALSPQEIRRIGLELRERFAAEKVVDRMVQGFRAAAGMGSVIRR